MAGSSCWLAHLRSCRQWGGRPQGLQGGSPGDGELHVLRQRLHRSIHNAVRKYGSYLLMATALLAAPGIASAVPVVVHLEAPAAKVAARLVFTPSDLPLHGEPPPPRSVEAVAPGETTVDLPVGSRWSVAATAPGRWARTELLAVSNGEVVVRLQPAGMVHAQIEVPPGESLPQEMTLRLRPAAAKTPRPTAASASSSSETCQVKDRKLACPAPAGMLDLRLRSKGFISHYRWAVAVPANGDLDLGKLALRRGASVVGTVAAPAKDFRFEDCRVELTPRITSQPTESDQARNGDRAETARLNAQGFFELAGIAPGTYRLTVRHPLYAPAVVLPVEVAAGAETEVQRIDLHLPVAVEVRLNPATDAFLRRWTVALSREGEVLGYSTPVAQGATDAEGRFKKAGLESGEYTVEVTDSRGARWAGQRFTLGSEPMVIDLDVLFQRVQGTVTLGGEPLAANLLFGGAHGDLGIAARSDEKGRFHVFLPRLKRWDVDVTTHGDPHVVSHLKGLEVVAVEHAPGVLDIELPDTRLAVEVVDELGQPAGRASIRAVREGDLKPVAERIADGSGKVDFYGLAAGTWHLAADGTDAAGHRESSDAAKVELREKTRSEPVRLILKPGWKLSGEVVSPSGSGVFGAEILATLEPDIPFAHLDIPATHTDLDGTFTLDIPASASAARLTVLPAGFALRQLPPQGPDSGPLIISVDQQGGTVVIDGLGDLAEYGQKPDVPYLLGQHPLPLPLAYAWAHLNGNTSWPAGEMIVPMLEPGTYSVCRPATPSPRCVSGTLAPGGQLRLSAVDAGPAPSAISIH